MPWLKIGSIWYEVPEGTEPIGDEELVYEKPADDEKIVSFAAALAAGILLWAWDVEAAQYTLIGEGLPVGVLSYGGMGLYCTESIQASGLATDFLAGFWADGTLPVEQWFQFMRQEIKEEYIRQFLLGRGGRMQMAQADWGSIGGMIKEQYQYLDKFYDQLRAGELSEAQVRARARMYTRSAREGFERGKGRAAREADYTMVLWVLGQAEHCPDCLELNAMGWQLIEDDPYEGCYPGSGCTLCLTNCMCFLLYQ